MRSCAIAVQFHPRGFTLPCLVALPLVCPIPPACWFMVGPCVQESILFLYWEFSVTGVRGRWPVGGCHGYPPLLHFAHTWSLPALLSIGTYPPFWILFIDKFNIFVWWDCVFALVIGRSTCLTFSFNQEVPWLLQSRFSKYVFLMTSLESNKRWNIHVHLEQSKQTSQNTRFFNSLLLYCCTFLSTSCIGSYKNWWQ